MWDLQGGREAAHCCSPASGFWQPQLVRLLRQMTALCFLTVVPCLLSELVPIYCCFPSK